MDASKDRAAATAPKMIRAGSLRPICRTVPTRGCLLPTGTASARGRAAPGHGGIRGHRRLRIGQSGLDRAARSRRRIQRIPADDREVPSPHTRESIKASPLDPPPDLTGALRGVPDSRGLPVVSRPELPQRFQKFALIIRRMFSRPVPLRVSDHPPSRSPTVVRLISFVATRCGDQVFLWRRSMRPFFCLRVAKTSQPRFPPRSITAGSCENQVAEGHYSVGRGRFFARCGVCATKTMALKIGGDSLGGGGMLLRHGSGFSLRPGDFLIELCGILGDEAIRRRGLPALR